MSSQIRVLCDAPVTFLFQVMFMLSPLCQIQKQIEVTLSSVDRNGQRRQRW